MWSGGAHDRPRTGNPASVTAAFGRSRGCRDAAHATGWHGIASVHSDASHPASVTVASAHANVAMPVLYGPDGVEFSFPGSLDPLRVLNCSKNSWFRKEIII